MATLLTDLAGSRAANYQDSADKGTLFGKRVGEREAPYPPLQSS